MTELKSEQLRQRHKRNKWFVYLSYVLVAALLSCGVTMSRYTGSVNGSGNGAVALMAISEGVFTNSTATTAASIDLNNVYPGMAAQTYYIKVYNTDVLNSTTRYSRVSQKYNVNFSVLKTLPLTYAVSRSSGLGDVAPTAISGSTTITPLSTPAETQIITVTDGIINFSTSTVANYAILALTVSWPSAGAVAADYSGVSERVTINVNSTQLD